MGTLLAGCSFTADFDGYTFGSSLDGGLDGGVDTGPSDTGPSDTGPSDTGPSDTGADADETPPMVVSSIPADGTNVLDGRMVLSVVFDEAINATEEDVQVMLDGTVVVPGAVAVDGATLRFTPTDLFANGDYTMTIADTLTDLSGVALAEEYVLSFTANPGAALTAFREEAGFGSIRCPELVQDEGGNVALTFMEDSTLYFALYRAGEGWSEAMELSTNAQDAHMAMSPGGRVAVAYTATVSDVRRPVVRVATDLLSTEFGDASFADEDLEPAIDMLDAPPAGSCSLQDRSMGVAVNDAGAVAVMWRTRGPVMSERFGWARNIRDAAGTWGSEAGLTSIYYMSSGVRLRPGIAMDSMGRVETVHYGHGESADPGYVFLAFDGSEWTDRNRSFQPGGSAVAPIALRRSDDSFSFVTTRFDGPAGGVSTLVESDAVTGGSLDTRLIRRADPDHVAYSTGADPWVVWRQGGLTLFGFLSGGVWRIGDAFSGPAIPASARNHVIASFPRFTFDIRPARALLLYEDGDAIRWTELADTPAGVDSRSNGLLFMGGGEIVREPRVVFDEESNHGVIAFVGLDGGVLRVANFRGMLSGALTL